MRTKNCQVFTAFWAPVATDKAKNLSPPSRAKSKELSQCCMGTLSLRTLETYSTRLSSQNHHAHSPPPTQLSSTPRYPVFGTQFHPEKNGFEWNPKEAFPHSADAVIMMQVRLSWCGQYFREHELCKSHTITHRRFPTSSWHKPGKIPANFLRTKS